MRQIRYSVACSLDGYIAGPKGEIDWIIMDPAIDFASIMSQFDTVLMGRKTFEHMISSGQGIMPGMATIVVSKTLQPNVRAGVTVLSQDLDEKLRDYKAADGKDIWLFGGGYLASHLIEQSLVDSIEVMVMPTLLGGGTRIFQGSRNRLLLKGYWAYETGIMSLKYECLT